MEDDVLYVIIFTVLIYIFEHKILPTLIIAFLSLWRASLLITVSVVEADVYIIFTYLIVFFYAAYMIFISPVVHEDILKTGDV